LSARSTRPTHLTPAATPASDVPASRVGAPPVPAEPAIPEPAVPLVPLVPLVVADSPDPPAPLAVALADVVAPLALLVELAPPPLVVLELAAAGDPLPESELQAVTKRAAVSAEENRIALKIVGS
jgi:hypothetical protein